MYPHAIHCKHLLIACYPLQDNDRTHQGRHADKLDRQDPALAAQQQPNMAGGQQQPYGTTTQDTYGNQDFSTVRASPPSPLRAVS